jgi:hypothetical protein
MFKLQLNRTKVEQLDLGGAAESSGGKRFIAAFCRGSRVTFSSGVHVGDAVIEVFLPPLVLLFCCTFSPVCVLHSPTLPPTSGGRRQRRRRKRRMVH